MRLMKRIICEWLIRLGDNVRILLKIKLCQKWNGHFKKKCHKASFIPSNSETTETNNKNNTTAHFWCFDISFV